MVSPTARSPRVGLSPAYARSARVARRPQHPFRVATRPFQIQPVLFAVVLPGETLKSLLIQSQVWSDPLQSEMKNTGWWCEFNCFYVKHRDLPGWEIGTDGLGKDLIDMMVSGEALTGQETAFVPWTNCAKGGIDFLKPAMERIVEEYFRDQGETAFGAGMTLDSVPLCQIYGRGRADVWERLTLTSAYADRRVKLDADADGTIYVGDEIERAWTEWAAMRDAGVIDMDYRDWMAAYGGSAVESSPDRVDFHRPEDLAYFREFSYPTNTVDPVSGKPAVAVGWRVASRLDKQVRFDEPGWIVVTNTIRPKVYLKNQQGSVTGMMISRNQWLPPQRNDEWTVSHAIMANPTLNGPLIPAAIGEAVHWDVRDLLNHGEQFVNFVPSGPSFMALPTATGQRRYPAGADIDAMFSVATENKFRQDGMISLSILGRQQSRGTNLVLGKS